MRINFNNYKTKEEIANSSRLYFVLSFKLVKMFLFYRNCCYKNSCH
ncbi:hypothetical protein [uncultured Winogradskyella sp.]